MVREINQSPAFPGFPDFRANVTFTPIQFFTAVSPHCSRGTVRIVGYALRKVLGWVDQHGNPTREQLQFTYRELIEKAGVSRDAIADALREAMERRCLCCLEIPRSDTSGRSGQSGIYELCWDKDGPYTDDPDRFRGFYYPAAAIIEELEGTATVRRPKAARKNIPNAFFDHLLPRERLSVIRVVGALLFYSIQWGPGGERKIPVSRSITELSRLTRLSRQHVHKAVLEARQRGYIEQVDAGCFDPAAGRASRAATYGIRWAPTVPAGRTLRIVAEVEPEPPVRKGERELDRSEKVDGVPVGKGERDQSGKVNGERSEMVNGISVKTELKTEQTTTATLPVVPGLPSAARSAAAVESPFDLLIKTGFDDGTAQRLAQKRTMEVIQRQIEWLHLRAPTRNRLGLLRRAIEQDWSKPEGAVDADEVAGPLLQHAKLFASHYYAGYHDYAGVAATEPFPKEIEMAAKFVVRLLIQERQETLIPEWGRRFGRFMRDKHQGDSRAKPNLSFALVLFGDGFLRTLQRETTARRRVALGKAKESHEAAFMPEYIAYLRLDEKTLQQTRAGLYEAFAEDRRQLRHQMTSGAFLASAARLARFDSEESRLLGFAEFFQKHPQHVVLGFWDWDARMNPRRFGSSLPTSSLREVHA